MMTLTPIRSGAAAALLAALTLNASGAELPVEPRVLKAPPKTRPMVYKAPIVKTPVSETEPVVEAPAPERLARSWHGGYFGLSVGGRWSEADWLATTLAGGTAADPSTAAAIFNTRDVRYGGYVGHNWHVSPWVIFGIEGDVGYADRTRALGGIPGTFAAGNVAALANDGSRLTLGWDASLRGRIGLLATHAWIVYGTAGVAAQQVDMFASCTVAGGYCALARAESFEKTRIGWTAGGGVEGRVAGNWLARFEYRYADYGTLRHSFFDSTADEVNAELKLKTHTGLFGLAYKFDWTTSHAAPLVVRF